MAVHALKPGELVLVIDRHTAQFLRDVHAFHGIAYTRRDIIPACKMGIVVGESCVTDIHHVLVGGCVQLVGQCQIAWTQSSTEEDLDGYAHEYL